jgi:hypothetical protein
VAAAKQARSHSLDGPRRAQLVGPTTALVAPPPARATIGLVAPPQPGLRVRQLFQEARKASLDHIGEVQSAMALVQVLLDDVVEGGAVYAPGLTDFAVRLKEDLFWRSKSLEALAQRQRLHAEGANP